jgi:hypothetical protein
LAPTLPDAPASGTRAPAAPRGDLRCDAAAPDLAALARCERLPAAVRGYLRGELGERERADVDRRALLAQLERARRAALAPRRRVERDRGRSMVPPALPRGVAGDLAAALAELPDRRSLLAGRARVR